MHGDTPGGEKTVVAFWYRGTYLLADEAMWHQATPGFDGWRRQAGLDRGFSNYRIDGAELIAGSDPPSAVVSVTIDGANSRVLVRDGKPIEGLP